jgi:peptide deformylase
MIQLSEDLDILTQPCQQLHNQAMLSEQLPIIREAIQWISDPKNKALGLAAPQIGQPYAWFVMKNPTDAGWFGNNLGKVFGVINPKNVSFSGKTNEFVEGCLSYPNKSLKVKRAMKVTLTFLLVYPSTDIPKEVTMTFEGKSAQIVQHELAHLRGRSPHCHLLAKDRADQPIKEVPVETALTNVGMEKPMAQPSESSNE